MIPDRAETPAMRLSRTIGATLACLFSLFAWLLPTPAAAQIGSDRYSAIVMDARNGNVLIAANADEERYPASLTKMMTLYMLFEALREGRVQLNTPIRMSEEAASRPPSKLGLPPGMTLTAEQAILALVTKSANDVAAAVGEHLAGSEDRFAQLMTMRARSIGMTRTTFRNASGLPDQENTTTARDMATLGLRLIRDFPDRYRYFSTVHFAWGRQMIRNHNRMVGDYEGADGIKTGYIRASGFNIVTSAQRDGVRLVGVTMGGSSWVERDRHMGALLDQGFAQLGVAPRPPSSVMAAVGAVGAARAASAGGRAVATRNAATQQRVGPGRGTTAAAAARRAVAPRTATTTRPAPTVQRTSARTTATNAARIEQGSRAAPVSAGRGSLPAPVRRTTTTQASR
ncbi:D-alanyl-D-alanine carboxypeptidase family protein [Neoroseomonas oryzicola]|nr:D-alanyl-D-alanine carboxypeptidase family protein [Neoroseomonas oryzicola]